MSSANHRATKKRQPEPEFEPEDVLLSDDDLDDEDEEDMDFIDPSMLLQSLLSTEDGSDTICTALVKIHSQLEIHNKIMVKLLTHLTAKKKES